MHSSDMLNPPIRVSLTPSLKQMKSLLDDNKAYLISNELFHVHPPSLKNQWISATKKSESQVANHSSSAICTQPGESPMLTTISSTFDDTASGEIGDSCDTGMHKETRRRHGSTGVGTRLMECRMAPVTSMKAV